ncbi:MAG: asparagine synthase (glutamine-hydrolyzing) [Magnetococcus sp. DMHC-1]
MCGITGFFSPRRETTASLLEQQVGRMNDALAHRGPDASGIWTDPQAGIALGHRRLAILDLSPNGQQPMVAASGRYVTVFNGEIYNFADLRRQLTDQNAAPAWRGHSDTEVMLAALDHWGVEGALPHLHGMFALAIWDRQNHLLHLVRDRIGKKPLYYGWFGGIFGFASELTALRAHPAWNGKIDRQALTTYLRHGYVPDPFSIFLGIAKLTPGSILTLPTDSIAQGELPQPQSYWSLATWTAADPPVAESVDETTALQELDRLLHQAVSERMVADVPLGAFLSGGMDSSLITAYMQAHAEQPVRTFTIGFHEAGFDEAVYARAVAAHLGTRHTELYLTAADALAVIPRLATLSDEPFADASLLPMFLVSRLAREEVTVALSGDGGDEFFCGYGRYRQALAAWQRMATLSPLLRHLAGGILGHIPEQVWQIANHVTPRLNPRRGTIWSNLLRHGSPDLLYQYLVSCHLDPARLVVNGTEPATRFLNPEQWGGSPDFCTRMMFLDAHTYLPGSVLVKVDRATMAVGLEARAPLLDTRIIEWAWRLPRHLKLRPQGGKWLLRRLLRNHLPAHLIERPKQGFGVPVGSWLRGPLRPWGEALLAPERLHREGWLNPQAVGEVWAAHQAGRRQEGELLWAILMFQAWLATIESS